MHNMNVVNQLHDEHTYLKPRQCSFSCEVQSALHSLRSLAFGLLGMPHHATYMTAA